MNQNVIVVTGPTASGKTDFALKLANYADIEIISADSRQIYLYLNIGTAKPTKAELNKVQHHIIDFLKPDEEFSAGKFSDIAINTIKDIKSRGKIPVVVGGTGFYIKALFEGLSDVDESDYVERNEIRTELNTILKDHGKDFLYDMLVLEDPVAAEKYSDKNPRRVIRALEFIRANEGMNFSSTFGSHTPSGFTPHYYVLNPQRDDLYKKINERTEQMFSSGLIREVAEILEMGYPPMLNSLNTVGYKECISMIFGDISLEQAIEETKKNTRRYAKRQITWLNQLPNYEPVNSSNPTIMNDIIDKYLRGKILPE
jgi:tRNA dimethylallyltransferase